MKSNLNADAGLLNILLGLLETISTLRSSQIYEFLFPLYSTKARQAIINLYHPGEGSHLKMTFLGAMGMEVLERA